MRGKDELTTYTSVLICVKMINCIHDVWTCPSEQRGRCLAFHPIVAASIQTLAIRDSPYFPIVSTLR
jgi:hypothetical protein